MTQPWALLAEDNEDMRELLKRVLLREGLKVVEAEDGFELADSLSLVAASAAPEGPSLVLADIHMPGRNGLEVISQARAAGLRCPVAILSAFIDDETIAQARRAGVDLVLAKPTPLDQLGEKLSCLLRDPRPRSPA